MVDDHYDRYIVPTAGKVYWDGVLSGGAGPITWNNTNPRAASADRRRHRLIADASMTKAIYNKQKRAQSLTEFKLYPDAFALDLRRAGLGRGCGLRARLGCEERALQRRNVTPLKAAQPDRHIQAHHSGQAHQFGQAHQWRRDNHALHHDQGRNADFLQRLGKGQPVLFSHGWPLSRRRLGAADAVPRRARLSRHRPRSPQPRPLVPDLGRQQHGPVCRRSGGADREAGPRGPRP